VLNNLVSISVKYKNIQNEFTTNIKLDPIVVFIKLFNGSCYILKVLKKTLF